MRARGLHETAGNRLFFRLGPLTGRFLKHALRKILILFPTFTGMALYQAASGFWRPFEFVGLVGAACRGVVISRRRLNSCAVKTLIRKICASSCAERFDSRVCRSLEILWNRGRLFHAGVTTLRIRDFENPVGHHMIFAGLPLGIAFLTNLLIRAVGLIMFVRLSNHTPLQSAGKDALREEVPVL